jgi:hypothetical protein
LPALDVARPKEQLALAVTIDVGDRIDRQDLKFRPFT